jgi:hypothetical protein
MTTATTPALTEPTAAPAPHRQAEAILTLIEGLDTEAKVFVFGQLARQIYGEKPEGDWALYNEDGSAYLHLLSVVAYMKLYCTPERIARWEEEARTGPHHLFSDIVAQMQAGTLGQDRSCQPDTPSPSATTQPTD